MFFVSFANGTKEKLFYMVLVLHSGKIHMPWWSGVSRTLCLVDRINNTITLIVQCWFTLLYAWWSSVSEQCLVPAGQMLDNRALFMVAQY